MKISDCDLRSVIRSVLVEDKDFLGEKYGGWKVNLGNYRRRLPGGRSGDGSADSSGLVFPIRKRDRPRSYGPYDLNRDPIPSLAAQYAPDGPTPNARLYQRYNNSNQHLGIDIGVPIGTDVLSPAAGRITAASGHTMHLEGDDGRVYVFHHLDSFISSPGQSVTAGQVIARSGNKGPSTAPHLHFGVKENGSYIDPMTLWGASSLAAIPDAPSATTRVA